MRQSDDRLRTAAPKGTEMVSRNLGRREFMQLCSGSLTLAVAGCSWREGQAGTKHSTITVFRDDDERGLGPDDDDPTKFLVYLPLVTLNARGELERRIAESWEHSSDYRTWTVHLRKQARWHDGVPVTAHDVKFTMDLLMHPDVLAVPPGAYSVTVLDDNTYMITYHRRVGRIGSPADDDYTVYWPRHLLEKFDPKEFFSWEFWTHPVGNRPYRYLRHVPKTMMEFEANPDFYRGKPNIERAVLKFGDPSGPGTVTELLSGNVDVAVYVNTMDLPELTRDPRFQVYWEIYRAHGVWIITLPWNQRYPPFRDPNVRRALTLAINRRELLRVLNLPEDTPIFDVIFNKRQLHRGELPEPLPYDPELAKRLLDEAGWRQQKGDGLRQRDGRPFQFTILAAPFEGEDKAAVYIQAGLRRVGIQADVSVLEWQALARRVYAGEFEAAIFDWPLGQSEVFFGESEISDASEVGMRVQGSPIGYANPKVIALLKQLRVAFNPDEEDRIYRELWPIFHADLPVTFLHPLVQPMVAQRRVRGLSSPWRADPVWHMDDLWLED